MTDTQQCLKAYGDPRSKAFAAAHLVLYVFPDWLAAVWPPYQGKRVTRQWVNKDIIPALEAVFRELISTGLIRELLTFDGLGNVRFKRGMAEVVANLSIHAWFLAIDFNALQNPLGVRMGSRKGMFSPAFLAVWRKHGWVCGGDFSRPDGMHFQYIHPTS